MAHHFEGINAPSRAEELICLALEAIAVAGTVQEKVKGMTEEETRSVQSELRGIIDGILAFTNGPIDENQFDVRMRVFRQDLQNVKDHFSRDNSLDRSLLRFSKLLDSFQLLLAPLQQWLVRFQPNRTESAVLDPSTFAAAPPTQRTPTNQSSPPPGPARRDHDDRSAQPFTYSSEPHFSGVHGPSQGNQHNTFYTYNGCVINNYREDR
ncbi:hypothetical protein WG66_014391 [Moniliophthora roreri]|nr:hypothetical protein WG66_014391 [Moniliophthora roreri]